MSRQIIALIMVLSVVSALSDSYVQVVGKDGGSVIEKTTDLSLFADRLTPSAFSAMESFCLTSASVDCSVDSASKMITIREEFEQGGYYSWSADYGFPFISQTISIYRLPSDRFSWDLAAVLGSAGIKGGEGVEAINLLENNSGRNKALKLLKINATYTLTMSAPISEAGAGDYIAPITGASAVFDLTEVYTQAKPIVVVSRQVNYPVIVILVMAIVLAALAVSFFISKPAKAKKKAKK